MEVHAHTHTPRKKWTHYFWEFLMLFLAVFAGFLAENQREHYVEHKRAKALISSLIRDLQKDTSLINWLTDFRIQKRQPSLHHFYILLNSSPDKINKKDFYHDFYDICEWYSFSQATGTINQLKNAGYLRYFSDDKLLNYISEYEFLVQDFKNDENMEFHLHYDNLVATVKQNADNEDMYKFYISDSLPDSKSIRPFTPEILHSIKAYTIEQMWYNNTQMIKQNERVKNKAIEFLNYLNSIR